MSTVDAPTDDEEFEPANVCTGCGHVTPFQCECAARPCPDCQGKGYVVDCIDDICHAREDCMHGDNRHCQRCDGIGGVPPVRVLVEPDPSAAEIRAYLREHPDLIKDEYRSEHTDADPLAGLCYVAAEAYYHAYAPDLHAYCLRWEEIDPARSGTHWYLRETSGEYRWIDPGLPLTTTPVDLPPYSEGSHMGGFITGNSPSQRTQQVLDDLDLNEGGGADVE